MARHRYRISAFVSHTSFRGETSSDVTKCRLFSQVTSSKLLLCFQILLMQKKRNCLKNTLAECLGDKWKRYSFPLFPCLPCSTYLSKEFDGPLYLILLGHIRLAHFPTIFANIPRFNLFFIMLSFHRSRRNT